MSQTGQTDFKSLAALKGWARTSVQLKSVFNNLNYFAKAKAGQTQETKAFKCFWPNLPKANISGLRVKKINSTIEVSTFH